MNIIKFWLEKAFKPEDGTDATPFLSDVYNKGTRARKRLADVSLYGRSMVEMLGVLAIIGVLSVGAIAGYQKAMLKYKLNKQTEQLNTLIFAVLKHGGNWNVAHGTELVPYLIKLGEAPQEMIKGNGNSLYDVFGLKIDITKSSGNDVGKDYIYFGTSFTSYKDFNRAICINILKTGKAFNDEMLAVGVNSTSSDDVNHQDWYYGRNDCNEYFNQHKRCLYQLDLQAMHQLCESCHTNQCGIFFGFKYNKF